MVSEEPGPIALVLADSQEACTSITSTAQKLFQRSGAPATFWRCFDYLTYLVTGCYWMLLAFWSCSWIEIAIDCHYHDIGRHNDVVAKSYNTTISQMLRRMSRSQTWLLGKFWIGHLRDMMIWVFLKM